MEGEAIKEKERKNVFIRGINPNIWEAFKNEASSRNHNRLWAVIAQELEHAITLYLKETPNTHTHSSIQTTQQLVTIRGMQKLDLVKDSILKEFDIGGTVSRNLIENIIRRILNISDKRAIKNKIERMIADGFLEYNWDKSIIGEYIIVKGDIKIFEEKEAQTV